MLFLVSNSRVSVPFPHLLGPAVCFRPLGSRGCGGRAAVRPPGKVRDLTLDLSKFKARHVSSHPAVLRKS